MYLTVQRVAVLLAQLGGLARPFRRNATFLDVALFAVGVPLLGRGDDRRVDDLPAFGQKPGRRQRRLKAREQDLDRRFAIEPGPRQRFAEGPDRVGVRHRVGQAQPEKAHERQAILDQIFGSLVRQAVAGLKDQHPEHQHVIKRRPTALRPIRARNRAFEIGAEQLKIHHAIQPFQLVALG